MKKEFKRNPILPLFFLLPAALFGFVTFLQFAMRSPVAFFTLIASVFMLYNSFWLLTNPLIRMEVDKVFFKESVFKQKEIFISNIEKIEFPTEKQLDLYQKDEVVTKVRLDMLSKNDREDFTILFFDLIDKNSNVNQW